MSKRKHNIKIRDNDDDNEKLNTSMFLLTINTNQAIEKNSKEYNKFKKTISNICNNITDYIMTVHGAHPDDEMNIDLQPSIEIGSKYHRLHSHIYISIEHNSKVQIDRSKLQELLPGYKIDARFIRAAGDITRIKNYIKKQQ